MVAKAVTIYNNAVSAGQWEEKDLKDAKILALTTRIDELVEQQEKLAALSTNQKEIYKSQNTQREGLHAIADWGMKKTTESAERDDKKWYWCPKHVVPGTYIGLYVTHKPENHDKWKRKKDNWRAKNKGSNNKTSDEPRKQDGKNKKARIDRYP